MSKPTRKLFTLDSLSTCREYVRTKGYKPLKKAVIKNGVNIVAYAKRHTDVYYIGVKVA